MNLARIISALVVSFSIVFGYAPSSDAAWIYRNTGGLDTWYDTQTGLTWTATQGQVPSSDNGQTARMRLSALGFRLPRFQELQSMYNMNGGGPVLQIRNGPNDYYETFEPHILGNAFGNGFQTPLMRIGIGQNWYIGVRP